MTVQANDPSDWEHWTDEERAEQERIVMERLRAAGVRFATEERLPRIVGKVRPKWLAFIIRTLRIDRD